MAQLITMSTNNSPHSRPSPARRRRPKPQAPAPAQSTAVQQSRLRRLLPAVLIPHGVAVLLVVVAAVAVLMFSATSMVALPATIAQLWLALNMSPVVGSGEVIGVIPMLPAVVMVWAVARRVHRSVRKKVSIADLGVLTLLVLALPLSLAGIASAMLYDASEVLDVDIPPVASMLGRVLLLHLIALGLGMGPRLWRALMRRYRAPEWLVDAAGLAMRFLRTYAAVTLVVVVVMITINYRNFLDSLSGYEDGGAALALIVMSLLYLPNVIISAMGVLVGAPFYFGDGTVSLFSVTLVPLPPLPVLAVIPATASQWAVVLLLIPAVVAVWVCLKNPVRLVVALSAAVFGAAFFLLLSLLAGGPLGVYGYVGLNRLSAAGLVLGYLVVVGLLISGIDRLRSNMRTPVMVEESVDPEYPAEQEYREPEAGPEVDPEPVTEEAVYMESPDGVDTEPEGETSEESANTEESEPAATADNEPDHQPEETDDGSRGSDR
ncbi:hypothetical protein CFAEC_03830 [Corynebacterium faecale]|nr:hypothetical protein CFAEC_03830 [Corynebacterium faecale]